MNQSSAELLTLAADISDMPHEKKAWLLGYLASLNPQLWEEALAAYDAEHKEAA